MVRALSATCAPLCSLSLTFSHTHSLCAGSQFAIDFDNIPAAPPPPLPDPTPEIVEAMRAMNEYCNLNGIDLAWDFEEWMGGKDKCTSDLMPREKFTAALGVLLGRATSLYQLDARLLDDIVRCYAAGEWDAKTLNTARPYRTQVQWREFALDVNRVQSMPFLQRLAGADGTWSSGVALYPQVGQYGDAADTDASRIRPVYGTTPTCCTATFGSMPSGHPSAMSGAGGAKGPGAKVSVAAGAKASSGRQAATGDKSTRSTQRDSQRAFPASKA